MVANTLEDEHALKALAMLATLASGREIKELAPKTKANPDAIAIASDRPIEATTDTRRAGMFYSTIITKLVFKL